MSSKGQHAPAVGIVVAAKELGLVEQTLRNWVKASAAGRLTAAGTKPVTPEQTELSRLRAEDARLKMHVEMPKKATAYFAWKRGGKPDRTRLSEAQAVALIKSIHAESTRGWAPRA